MEVFEIHITGDESIHEASKRLGLKSITIELLKPDSEVLRHEHMTSHVMRFPSYRDCLREVLRFVYEIEKTTSVLRVKIECPVYDHYVKDSLYLESHFETIEPNYPISRNIKKTTWLGTDRVYDHKLYDSFMNVYRGQTLELCLYDTFVHEDADWLDLWPSFADRVLISALAS